MPYPNSIRTIHNPIDCLCLLTIVPFLRLNRIHLRKHIHLPNYLPLVHLPNQQTTSHLLFANTFTEESDTESDSDSDRDSESDSQSESSSVESDDFSRAIGHIIPDDESIHGSETHSLQGLDELSADPLPIEDVSLDLSTIDPLTHERQDD